MDLLALNRTSLIYSASTRQRQCIGLYSLGLSHKKIGEILHISHHTVKNVVAAFAKKIRGDRHAWSLPQQLDILQPFMAEKVFCFSMPGLPPSVNGAYPNRKGRGKGRYLSKEAEQWKAHGMAAIKQATFIAKNSPLPIEGATGVTIFLHMPGPNVPNWDVNNRIKIVLDLLTSAKVWPDDRWNEFCQCRRTYGEVDEITTEVIVYSMGNEYASECA